MKGFLESYSLGTSTCSSLAGVAKKRVIHNITKSLFINRFSTCLVIVTKSSKTFSSSPNRAIFVWSWNEKAQTKQKQQMNGNRVLWWSNGYKWSKRSTEKLHPQRTFKEWIDTLLWHYSATWLPNRTCAFSTLRFSLARKPRVHVLIYSSIGW